MNSDRSPFQHARRQPADEEHLAEHDREQRRQRRERDAAEDAQDRGELRRARNAERQQQNRDQALLRRPQNARRHRRHRVAAEAEHHRQHRFAVEAHHAEDAIAEDREPRDVAAVLEESEHQEEGGDHRQHDRDRVGQAHRDEAVLADQEVADQRNRDEAIDQPDGRRVDAAAEHAVFEQLHERLRAEDADEQIQRVEHDGENRETGQRPPRRARERLRQPGQRQRADAAHALGQIVRPRRAFDRRAVGRRLRDGRVGQRRAQLGEPLPVDRHRFDDRHAELRRQFLRVDRDAPRPRFVDHVQHQDRRFPERGDLRCEHQRPPQIARIGHLHHKIGPVRREQVARDALVLADRAPERVHARRVDDVAHLGPDERAPLGDRHRRARVVGNGDVAAGQTAEHDALADVRLADERDAQRMGAQGEHRRTG